MRISILGAGGWGKNHVRTFCTLLGEEAVCVCDPDATRRRAMSEKHKGIQVSAHADLDGTDAAVIAAPAVLHHALAIEAIDAGKHVLVEKPLALTPSDARDLVHRAKEAGVILMVDHLMEYHPGVERLKAAVDTGRLGKLFHISSRRLNLGVVRTEENALWSLAPHDISIILYLLGEEPVEVAAYGAAFLQQGIQDVVHVDLRFESGVLGQVGASWLDPIKTRQTVAVGERAMAVFDDVADEKLIFYDRCVTKAGEEWALIEGEATTEQIERAEPLSRVAAAFLDAIRSGVQPRADGWDGLRVVRILDAAQRSMDAGGRPVKLEKEAG